MVINAYQWLLAFFNHRTVPNTVRPEHMIHCCCSSQPRSPSGGTVSSLCPFWSWAHQNFLWFDGQWIEPGTGNCGWKKSCTILDGWNPINKGINHHNPPINWWKISSSTVGLRGMKTATWLHREDISRPWHSRAGLPWLIGAPLPIKVGL